MTERSDPPLPAALADAARAVAARYGLIITSMSRASGGFSGAEVLRIVDDRGLTHAVRRWPPQTCPDRVAALHRVVGQLREAGFAQLARPYAQLSGEAAGSTVVRPGDSPDHALWHVEAWQPGAADFRQRATPKRAAAVGHLLATLHHVVARFSDTNRHFAPGSGIPRSLGERLEQALFWQKSLPAQPRNALKPRAAAAVRQIQGQLPELIQRLRTAASVGYPTLPICLRDLWHDSVLWSHDDITGLIDLGAARVDHPVGDIARLFGSLFENDRSLWNEAIGSYERVRPLAAADHQLLVLYVESEVALSTLGWIDRLFWTYPATVDQAAAESRLQHYLDRLEGRPGLDTRL